ncbi:molecular chaperone DnaJ [Massilia cavernae]|uniref:Molecular chaperone DnaJ n=1 Tax=Massilia cavernae TaxID=2320864 RepID=A0A418Y7G1_9BURK|nr:molecular chaperone DnaJ [Massilia cavernae]RJG26331.1 molecular chaperone DnaJ [Massilia cavernae]
MDFSSTSGIRIAAPSISPVSRVRKQFNTLVKKLEAERKRLAAWHEALPEIQRQVETGYLPLARAFDGHRKALLELFDRAHAHKAMGKKDKAKLVDLISSIALSLLDEGEDEDVRALFNKHAGGDIDFGADGFEDSLKDMVEDLLGVRIDDDADVSSPEALFRAMSEKMAARAQQEKLAADGGAAEHGKSAKPSARELRQQAEQQRLQQSVREIYRKLASALHPDREQDVAERERKTALMQRVNVAYAANDFLGLLELQLQIDQIDQAVLDQMSDERIKQYNKVLDGQVRELQRETSELEYSLMRETRQPIPRQITPTTLAKCLYADIAQMQASVDTLARDLIDFQDIKVLKAWLKTYVIPADIYPDEYYF